MNWKRWWLIGYAFFKEETAFQLSFLVSKLREFVNLIVIFLLWYALLKHNFHLKNYTNQQTLSYFIYSFIVGQIILSTRLWRIGDMIISGNISALFLYPIKMWQLFLSWDIAHKVINFSISLFYLLPFLFLFHLTPFQHSTPTTLIFFILSLILGSLIYSFIVMIFDSLAFYLTEMWSISFLLNIFLSFFSGQFFPLDAVSSILVFSPFAYVNFWPSRLLARSELPSHPIFILTVGSLWLLIFSLTFNALWRSGLKKFSGWGE